MMIRSFTRAAALGVILMAGVARASYDPTDPVQAAEYAQALELGTQAYVYGVPLLDMERTFQTHTSVNVPDERGNAPVNQFSYVRHLSDPLDRTVVNPNHDTLYSIAWLDLKAQPIVVHVPDSGSRFNVVPLLDPYQENFA